MGLRVHKPSFVNAAGDLSRAGVVLKAVFGRRVLCALTSGAAHIRPAGTSATSWFAATPSDLMQRRGRRHLWKCCAGHPPGRALSQPRGTFPAIRLGRALPNGRRLALGGVPFHPPASPACPGSAVPFPGRCR